MTAPCILDASAALAWAFRDELDEPARALSFGLADGYAEVPSVWHLEVANGLWVAERRGRITRDDALSFLATLVELDIRSDATAAERAFNDILDLAGRAQVAVYDAAYLDLALRRQLPLATRDEALAAAARRLGIALIPA
ncbi:MAG: VapC toxin family PIN domain ribonuclease [Alphaproteobacteria bacterium]|nr:VapC toxin family PIN domain ribonuclease [Alphaproteobacteria bacterium]